MSGKYEVVYIVYNRVSKFSIPYFAAAIVRGPRGGYKVLDWFSFQQMIRASELDKAAQDYYISLPKKTVPEVNVRYVMIPQYSVDTLINKVAAIYNKVMAKKLELIKRDSAHRAREIGTKLDTSKFRQAL